MATDPSKWTAAEVADFFRNRAIASISDLPGRKFPDMNVLAQTLEDNSIDGFDLMGDVVNQEFLREECNIKSFPLRRSIINCISRLREQKSPQVSVLHPTPQMTPTAGPIGGEHIRTGEQEVTDERGRKRRKLELSKPVEPVPVESAGLVERLNLDDSQTEPEMLPPGYLPNKAIPVDEIFFGKTPLGKEVGVLEPEGNLQQEDWDDSKSWTFQDETKTAGEIDFVYQQMRYFFQNEATTRDLKRRGRDAVAITPYRADLIPKNKIQSALVIQMRDDVIRGDSDEDVDRDAMAVRENVTYLDAEGGYDGAEQTAEPGAYDYLVEKYGRQKDILPEDEDDAASVTSTLYDEIESENEDRARRKLGVLSRDEVKEVVDERIDAMALAWREKMMPHLETKEAWKVWKQTKRSRSLRDDLVGQANSTIAMLSARLAKQLNEIQDVEWKSKDAIRGQCESMQVTVEDREEQKWKIEVWQRKQEPYHEIRQGHRPSTSKLHKSTAANAGPPIHPTDRLSVEPAPAPDSGGDDEYHTPAGSPEVVPEVNNDADNEDEDFMDLAGDDESSLDFVEESPSQLLGPLSNGPSPARSAKIDASSDSDLPSYDSFVRPKSSSTAKPDPSEIIDISSDSTSPSVKKEKKTKANKKAIEVEFSKDPWDATASQVREWGLEYIVDRQDRVRLLIKLLLAAGLPMRKDIQACLTRFRPKTFGERLVDALHALNADWDDTGSDVQENAMIACARIYLSYLFNNLELRRSDAATGIDWKQALHDKSARAIFVDLLMTALPKSESKLFVTPKKSKASSSSVKKARFDGIISLDTDSDDVLNSSPAKKRKQKLSERAANKQSQAQIEAALQRQERFEKAMETQKSNSQQLAAMLPSGTPSRSTIMINPLKGDEEEPIYVDSKIAPKMKDHQVKGVQFMWRELTVEENGRAQGCVLAHTMGLGKTMQTITVLVALDEAARSKNSAVYKQLPSTLRLPRKEQRQLRILILCPPVLLKNWQNEIGLWAVDKFPMLYVVESGQPNQKRDVEDWHRFGGVLLMGYQNFRAKIPQEVAPLELADDEAPSKAQKRAAALDRDLARMLLDGPEVVVADEAHALKNETAGITQAARQFKTLSRIALTGTPMSNDVDEIYSLISWIDPMYLGDLSWFTQTYSNPIKAGMSKDSTYAQRRAGLKKLDLLHKRIGPKVDRATIEVLKDSLTTKVEFHLTVPLTEIQRKTYKDFVSALRGGAEIAQASQVTIFSWLALLTLLANHPLLFKQKMLTPLKPRKATRKIKEPSPGNSDGSVTPLAEGEVGSDDSAEDGVRALGFSQDLINAIVADITSSDHTLSAKMTIVMDIVQLSKRCGDKVIIFTHTLITLDYLGELFRHHGIACGRIDGKVPAPKRMPMLDQFERGDFDVLIISTRAGGTGLNIQTANRVIIMDNHFNPAHEEQAIGRAYRLGQRKPVFVYRLVTGGTFEEDMWKKQLFKTSLSLRVVDKKQVQRAGNRNVVDYLYAPKDVPQEDVSKYHGRDKSVLDHILTGSITKDLVRAIETTETLQAEVVEQLTAEEQAEVDEFWKAEKNAGLGGRAATFGGMAVPPSTAPARSASGKAKRTSTNAGVMAAPPASTAGKSLVARLPVMPHGLPNAPFPTSSSRQNRQN